MNKYRIVYLEFTTMRKTVTVDAEDWMTARDLAFIVDDDESEDVTKGDQYEVVEITTLGPAKMNDDDLWSMINEINSDMDEGRLTKEEGVPRLRNICKEYLKDTETEKRHALQDVEFGEVVIWTVPQILEEINRDRSGEWEDYNETDWQDGLSMTNYKYLGEVK